MTTTRSTRKTRLHISAIEISPKKPPKYPIYLGILVDGDLVHKLPPTKNLPLLWSVDLPIDVGPHSQVVLQVREVHRVRVWQGNLGSCIISDHTQWLKYESTGAQIEIVQHAEKFTVSVKFSPSLGIRDVHAHVKKAIEAAENIGSVLGILGRARSAIETIVSVLEQVEDFHPIAKAALGTLTKLFKFLEDEENYDGAIRDLASGIANMLSFAETVNQYAKIVQLKDTIAQMMLVVEDAARFIIEDQSSTAIGRTAMSLVYQGRRNKIDEYIKNFDALRKGFDRGVAVQVLDVGNQVLRVVAATEERSLEEQDRLLLDKLPLAHSAFYDPSRCCMDGTRVKILQDVMEWTSVSTGSTAFLWIHGSAGAGKSAIASSTARQLEKGRLLGATFFCSRDKPELQDPTLVLPTIAARLAVIFPVFGKAIADQLRRDPHIGRSAMQFQFEGLFAAPVKQINESALDIPPIPIIIVIDALDECGDPESRSLLLKYLLEISALANWLKVIATSRPEADITRSLKVHSICTSFPLPLDDTAALNDIFLFTKTCMAKIAQMRGLQPSEWPGELKIKQLAERAGGLFIWAQTAYKFIASGHAPEERLSQLLSKTPPLGVYSKLDALYTTALAGAFQESDSDNLEISRLVIGTIITVRTPLPIQGLFGLLRSRVSETAILSVIESFRSVLYKDKQKGSVIRVCHLSFTDFVTDPLRCPLFFIDLPQHHSTLATVSFQMMQDGLRFNICNLESSDLFNDQVPNLAERVQDAIPITLRYCCIYWMSHLYNAPRTAHLVEELNHFLTGMSIIFWIEALSLMGEIAAAIYGLPLVVRWFEDRGTASSLFIADIHRFILAFKEPIIRSIPQLYISALPFAPTQSMVSQRFLPAFPNTISLDDQEPFWSSCLQTLEGHSELVRSVSWSPDGRRLVSGSLDATICIWDSTTGSMLQRLRGHSDCVSSVSFSPTGKLIASGSWDSTIQIWDAETGAPILAPFIGHTLPIHVVIFSPNGNHLASCSNDHTIRIWDVSTGQPILDPFIGHSDLVRSIAYSPDGERIVSGSYDVTVRVWDVHTGHTVLGPLTGHSQEVYTVDFSPDGQYFLSGSRDCSIIVWNSTTGITSFNPLQVGDTVLFAKFSLDGRYILSTSLDSETRIWHAENGHELSSHGHSGSISSACFSPDGRHFVTGSSDHTVRVWELNLIHPPSSAVPDLWHTDMVNSVAFSPDGKYIVSGSRDRTVRVWHADTCVSACAPLRGHRRSVVTVTFSPSGSHILSTSYDKTLRLWRVPTWENVGEPFHGHDDAIECAMFSPDGQHIISGSHDHTIRLWDPMTGKEICEPLRGHSAPVLSLNISTDGNYIASGSEDQTIKIWNFSTRMKLFDLSLLDGDVWSLAFSPDGRYLASYTNNISVRLWGAQEQTLLWKSQLASSRGCCVFSRNSKQLFCSSSSLIHVLDANTGSVICKPFKGHAPTIQSMAISPDGKRLVSGSFDYTIRMWDIEFHDEDDDRQELLPNAQHLFRQVNHDGWIQQRAPGDPLLWIPTEYRDGLWKRAILSIPPTTPNHPRTMDCSRFQHGTAWTKCKESEGFCL